MFFRLFSERLRDVYLAYHTYDYILSFKRIPTQVYAICEKSFEAVRLWYTLFDYFIFWGKNLKLELYCISNGTKLTPEVIL